MARAGKSALADQQNRHEEALHILKQIRPAERAQKEYDDISTLIKIEAGNKYSTQNTFTTILTTPWILKILLVGITGPHCSKPPG